MKFPGAILVLLAVSLVACREAPSPGAGNASGNNTAVYLQDGSFTKVREITLGYDLPQVLVNAISGLNAKSARINVSGRNLFIISGYNGFDPEVNNGGNFVARFVDLAPFPPSRSFFLSVDVGF